MGVPMPDFNISGSTETKTHQNHTDALSVKKWFRFGKGVTKISFIN